MFTSEGQFRMRKDGIWPFPELIVAQTLPLYPKRLSKERSQMRYLLNSSNLANSLHKFSLKDAGEVKTSLSIQSLGDTAQWRASPVR